MRQATSALLVHALITSNFMLIFGYRLQLLQCIEAGCLRQLPGLYTFVARIWRCVARIECLKAPTSVMGFIVAPV